MYSAWSTRERMCFRTSLYVVYAELVYRRRFDIQMVWDNVTGDIDRSE